MQKLLRDSSTESILASGQVFSRKTILSASEKLADSLKQTVPDKSPFIYLIATNSIKTVIAYFGILRAGFSCVLIDPATKPLELRDRFQDTPPVAIIRCNNNTELFDYSDEIDLCPTDASSKTMPEPLGSSYTLVYTAAEFGVAKGAMLSENNLLSNAKALAGIDEADCQSVVCSLLPLSHLFALMTGVISPLVSGASIMLEDVTKLTRIESISDGLEHWKVTHLYSTPMIYYLLGKVPEIKKKLRSVKYATSGGYKLPASVFESCRNKLGVEIQEGYGLSEASPICSWHRPSDKIKIDSVGRVFPDCEVRAIDEYGIEVPIGSTGEIAVRGPNVMQGYYNDVHTTKRTIVDGWLHTGDLGTMDKEGYVYLTGLKKRMLNVGGRNVYPAEVERFLMMHDNIEHVEVYGDFSELRGHVVKARAILKKHNDEAEDSLRQWCLDNLSHYKVPKFWEFL